jgi:hypothetical protein
MSDKKNNGIFDWEFPTIYDIIDRMTLSFICPPSQKEKVKKPRKTNPPEHRYLKKAKVKK